MWKCGGSATHTLGRISSSSVSEARFMGRDSCSEFTLDGVKRAPTHASEWFCNPSGRVEDWKQIKSHNKLNCAQSQARKIRRKFLFGKNRCGEGRFSQRTTFPSHSVSRFSAQSFYERGYLYDKVGKLKLKNSFKEFESEGNSKGTYGQKLCLTQSNRKLTRCAINVVKNCWKTPTAVQKHFRD